MKGSRQNLLQLKVVRMIRAKKSVQWICIKDKIIKEWKKQNADKKKKKPFSNVIFIKKDRFREDVI